MAEQIPAKFSATGIRINTTGVTVEKGGAEPKVCTMTTWGPAQGTTNSQGFIFAYNRWDWTTRLNCPNSTELVLSFYFAKAYYDTATAKYHVKFNVGSSVPFYTPWGQYIPNSNTAIGTWTNGAGATHSTITVNKTPIGEHGGSPGGPQITLSGTFTATTTTGGLLTLSH